MRGTLKAAAPRIVRHFDDSDDRVYRYEDLDAILFQNRTAWQLAKTVGIKDFIQFLTSHTYLRELALTSLEYRPVRRYIWRNVTPYQIALSRKPNAYLSHGTAAFLHKLIQNQSQMIFVNYEQGPAASGQRTSGDTGA